MRKLQVNLIYFNLLLSAKIKYQIMKRIFILFASSLLCLSTIAQISHQFVEEGKVWNMLYHNVEAFDIFPDYKYSYLIKGDTLISDMNCKKLYTFNENNDSITVYKLALYEIEGKVYFIFLAVLKKVASYMTFGFLKDSYPLRQTQSIQSGKSRCETTRME